MLLQALGSPILKDGEPLMQNFQINLDYAQRKLRMKTELLDGPGPPNPIDLVIYKYGDVKLEKNLSLSISFDGMDMLKKRPFSGKLSFNFIKENWKLSGTYGSFSVDKVFDTIVELSQYIEELSAK